MNKINTMTSFIKLCTLYVLVFHVLLIKDGMCVSSKMDQFIQNVERNKMNHRPGRHICTSKRTVSSPISVIQTYRKPVYTPKTRDCPNSSVNCPQFDVTYVKANRTVFHLQKTSAYEHSCCPGWTRQQRRDKGCMDPLCSTGCGDLGVCINPETCRCRQGYTGDMCDTDIDECQSRQHDCHHVCKNTAGSYICACQAGFKLSPDGKTCTFCFTCQQEYVTMTEEIIALQGQVGAGNNQLVSGMELTEVKLFNATIQGMTEKMKSIAADNIELHAITEDLAARNLEAQTGIKFVTNSTRSIKNKMKLLEIENMKIKEETKAKSTVTNNIQLKTNQLASDNAELHENMNKLTEQNTALDEKIKSLVITTGYIQENTKTLMNENANMKTNMKSITAENSQLVIGVSLLKSKYETIVQELETIRTAQQNAQMLPNSRSPVPQTSTTSSTTSQMTSSSPTTTAGFFSNDQYDLIISLSNQIGLMEENLELCQCQSRGKRRQRKRDLRTFYSENKETT